MPIQPAREWSRLFFQEKKKGNFLSLNPCNGVDGSWSLDHMYFQTTYYYFFTTIIMRFEFLISFMLLEFLIIRSFLIAYHHIFIILLRNWQICHTLIQHEGGDCILVFQYNSIWTFLIVTALVILISEKFQHPPRMKKRLLLLNSTCP